MAAAWDYCTHYVVMSLRLLLLMHWMMYTVIIYCCCLN